MIDWKNDFRVYSKSRLDSVLSQEKMDWLESTLKAKESTLEYAVAIDQLIKRHVLSDDKMVESNDEYWSQF